MSGLLEVIEIIENEKKTTGLPYRLIFWFVHKYPLDGETDLSCIH